MRDLRSSDVITSQCGCQCSRHSSGVLRSIGKCEHHFAMHVPPEQLDEGRYSLYGTVKDGGRAESKHVEELIEALGPLPPAECVSACVIEIGCGASPYVDLIRGAGYYYLGIDPSEWAVSWMNTTYGESAIRSDFDGALGVAKDVDLILAAHVLEHLPDAPTALLNCAGLLTPGGELWLVVPDDTDLCNPDHLWFFDEASLKHCLDQVDLETITIKSFQRVEREQFIYARARKPRSAVEPLTS